MAAALRNFWHSLRGYDNIKEGLDVEMKPDFQGDQRGQSLVGRVIVGLAVIGIIISMYMIHEFYNPLAKAFCDMSEGVSCTKLVLLGWASLFGVPIAVLGMNWNITLLVAQLLVNYQRRSTLILAIFIWSLGGVAFVVYLVSVEIFVGTICPMCTVIHGILLVVLGLAIYQLWKEVGQPPLGTIPSFAWNKLPWLIRKEGAFIAVALIFNALPLLLFNTVPGLKGAGDGWTDQMKYSLAHCLHKEHVITYTKFGCPYCAWQKSLFGKAVELLDVYQCTDPDKIAHCTDIKIIGYPTWVMYSHSGKEIKRHLGEMPLDDLDDWAGCKVHKAPKKPKDAPEA